MPQEDLTVANILLKMLANKSLGNAKAREVLGLSEDDYESLKADMLAEGLIDQGRGRGGSIKLATGSAGLWPGPHAAGPEPGRPGGDGKPKRGRGRPPKAKGPEADEANGQETTEPKRQHSQHPKPKSQEPKANTTMTSKQHLEATLWNIANALRGKMAADDFRDYILGFIFYKYLSEKMHRYADQVLEPDGLKYNDLKEGSTKGKEYIEAIRDLALDKLGYFLLPSELFHALKVRGEALVNGKHAFILDDLTKVLNNISNSTQGTESEDDFANLFEDLDLTSSKLGKSTEDKNELIMKVLIKLDGIDFELDDPTHDVLGDAYEYLIGQFASGAGKKAGEFYTPQEVSTVLARIVTTGKKRLKSVYDPTCGSGSLLLRVAKEVQDVGHFYGQEMNPTTYNLCRMNMIMHDVHYRRFDIKNEDTLERPQHLEERFEAVVANPPFSAHWKADPLKMNEERFAPYGRLAPQTKADFAFVQHMVYQLSNEGTMACVLPHGVLFRGAAEGHIRQYLIEERNYLDAVIGLPANIFYGTSIPTCILVLKKNRDTGSGPGMTNPANDILFIDASAEGNYEKVKTQNKLRPQDIDKIVETYRNRSSEAKYSYVAPLAEVKENDYNLNIPRYVDTFEAEEAVDLNDVAKELRDLDQGMQATDKLIAEYCAELGIEMPFA